MKIHRVAGLEFYFYAFLAFNYTVLHECTLSRDPKFSKGASLFSFFELKEVFFNMRVPALGCYLTGVLAIVSLGALLKESLLFIMIFETQNKFASQIYLLFN